MGSENNRGAKDSTKILLIGDAERIFCDAGAVADMSIEVCPDVSAGIEAASKESFSAVCLEIQSLGIDPGNTLGTLRKVSPAGRVVLLSQMIEEPLAMRLVGTSFGGGTLADDYLICPIDAGELCEAAGEYAGSESGEHIVPAADADGKDEKLEQLSKLATEDSLTGLKNRRYIWEFSRQIIELSEKQGRAVTLLLFDIDNLKSYNDVYGHVTGDEILKQASVLMSRCCRSHDVVGRIGGDEFAVVFWDRPDSEGSESQSERRRAAAEHPKEAIFIAKRFQRELEKAEFPQLGSKGRGVLTISGGLASFPRDGSTIDELFAQADKALLDAKRSGKNKIYLVGRPRDDIAQIE